MADTSVPKTSVPEIAVLKTAVEGSAVQTSIVIRACSLLHVIYNKKAVPRGPSNGFDLNFPSTLTTEPLEDEAKWMEPLSNPENNQLAIDLASDLEGMLSKHYRFRKFNPPLTDPPRQELLSAPFFEAMREWIRANKAKCFSAEDSKLTRMNDNVDRRE